MPNYHQVTWLNPLVVLGHSSFTSVIERCGGVGDEGYRFRCLSSDGLDVSTECGPSCGCGLECGNRLTQNRIAVRLKIVKDRRKGWALYSDQLIQKGQFICELLTTKEARRRHQNYDEIALHGLPSS